MPKLLAALGLLARAMPAYKEIASHAHDAVLYPMVKFRPWSTAPRQGAEPGPESAGGGGPDAGGQEAAGSDRGGPAPEQRLAQDT